LVLVVPAAIAGTIPVWARQDSITCRNTSSGTEWKIHVDYERHTVDANPARISDGEISWHDPSDAKDYTLDRKSGALTAVGPSSTGGYFLFDRCKLPG
jgi:hypothetical protein